jgi:hypothetical protein
MSKSKFESGTIYIFRHLATDQIFGLPKEAAMSRALVQNPEWKIELDFDVNLSMGLLPIASVMSVVWQCGYNTRRKEESKK